MYTEQDTFDRLRRIDFDTAYTMYVRFMVNQFKVPGKEVQVTAMQSILESTGWTYESLMDELSRRRNR
jgi:hypothetical protein